jgi:type II secretory pathway pseudopilin PulG
LIIVLVVLVALAALVVPTLGFVRDQAGFATSAAGAAEVLNNLEIYKASTGNYPNRLDTLVGTDGAVFDKLYGASTGSFVYGTIVPGSSGGLGYFLENGGGMTEFMQHTQGASDPNASTETGTPVSSSAASFAIIDPDSADPTYAAKMRRIVRAAYPNQTGGTGSNDVAIPEGHTLVALGVGSRASCVGTTMTSAPVHTGAAEDAYSRYIAIFDVSAGPTFRGKVQLKLVVDSEFEVLAKNVANYKASGPVDEEAVFEAPATP